MPPPLSTQAQRCSTAAVLPAARPCQLPAALSNNPLGCRRKRPRHPASAGIKWGADLKKLGICVALGSALWFVPPPAGVTLPAWHLLAIFLSTIAGIITTPLPLGAVAMLGLGASMMTGTLSFAAAFSAFASEIPWLIAIAFWLSGGFIRSGLGARIAYSIVSLFGKTTLGLVYSLVAAEALLAPAIPSVAARAGGLFLPLAKALCLACGEWLARSGEQCSAKCGAMFGWPGQPPMLTQPWPPSHPPSHRPPTLTPHPPTHHSPPAGSDPANGTERKMGSFLMMTCFLCTTISSGMFITAMAANPLAVNLAAETLGYTISWGGWVGGWVGGCGADVAPLTWRRGCGCGWDVAVPSSGRVL